MCELIENERQRRMEIVRKEVLLQQEEAAAKLTRSELKDRFHWEDLAPTREPAAMSCSPASRSRSGLTMGGLPHTRRVSPGGDSRRPCWESDRGEGPSREVSTEAGKAGALQLRQLEDRVAEMDTILRTNLMQRLKSLEDQAGQLKMAIVILFGMLFMAIVR